MLAAKYSLTIRSARGAGSFIFSFWMVWHYITKTHRFNVTPAAIHSHWRGQELTAEDENENDRRRHEAMRTMRTFHECHRPMWAREKHRQQESSCRDIHSTLPNTMGHELSDCVSGFKGGCRRDPQEEDEEGTLSYHSANSNDNFLCYSHPVYDFVFSVLHATSSV